MAKNLHGLNGYTVKILATLVVAIALGMGGALWNHEGRLWNHEGRLVAEERSTRIMFVEINRKLDELLGEQ